MKIIKPTNSLESDTSKNKNTKMPSNGSPFFFQLLFAGLREEILEVLPCKMSSFSCKEIFSCLTCLFRTLNSLPFIWFPQLVFGLYGLSRKFPFFHDQFYLDVQNSSWNSVTTLPLEGQSCKTHHPLSQLYLGALTSSK